MEIRSNVELSQIDTLTNVIHSLYGTSIKMQSV